MKLCAFAAGDGLRLGAVLEDGLADLNAADPAMPRDMIALLEGGESALEAARRAAERAPRTSLAAARLAAPIPRPNAFYAVGLNYAAHAREVGAARGALPACFMKPPGCVIGPDAAIVRPRGYASLDYEGELGIVIGRRCRNVRAGEARAVIGGYVIVNDVTVREMIAPDRLILAKGCDTFGPIGPWLTTADEIDDPGRLRIRTLVDGALRQDGSTADLIHPIGRLIEIFSRATTLYPGDILSTGSPPGSGASFDPPLWLQPGQEVAVEIEGLGRLRNVVVDEVVEKEA